MRNRGGWARGLGRRMAVIACLASTLMLFGGESQTTAQEGQGKYITEASTRLVKLVDKANAEGYKMQDDAFSIGGGWLKQGNNNWVPLFTVNLKQGRSYRFIAAGDLDAKDVDLEVHDPENKVVAADTATNAEAVVNYTAAVDGRHLVRIRLYDSDKNLPCVCLGVVTSK